MLHENLVVGRHHKHQLYLRSIQKQKMSREYREHLTNFCIPNEFPNKKLEAPSLLSSHEGLFVVFDEELDNPCSHRNTKLCSVQKQTNKILILFSIRPKNYQISFYCKYPSRQSFAEVFLYLFLILPIFILTTVTEYNSEMPFNGVCKVGYMYILYSCS